MADTAPKAEREDRDVTCESTSQAYDAWRRYPLPISQPCQASILERKAYALSCVRVIIPQPRALALIKAVLPDLLQMRSRIGH